MTIPVPIEEWLEEQGFDYNPEKGTWEIQTEIVCQFTEERSTATIYCTVAQAEEYRQRGERWI